MIMIENNGKMKGSLEDVKQRLENFKYAFDSDRQCIVLKFANIINHAGIPIVGRKRREYVSPKIRIKTIKDCEYWMAWAWTEQSSQYVSVFDFPLTPKAEKYVDEFLEELVDKFAEFWQKN